MKKFQIGPIALVGAIFGALPTVGLAQQSQFPSSYAATSVICTHGDGGAENRSACIQSLHSLLLEVRLQTDGAQYDIEIAALALTIVNAYIGLPSPTAPVCLITGDALGEVGQSAADPSQAGQINAVAERIRACSGLSRGTERLLASPN